MAINRAMVNGRQALLVKNFFKCHLKDEQNALLSAAR
jgi:hypothetical protein